MKLSKSGEENNSRPTTSPTGGLNLKIICCYWTPFGVHIFRWFWSAGYNRRLFTLNPFRIFLNVNRQINTIDIKLYTVWQRLTSSGEPKNKWSWRLKLSCLSDEGASLDGFSQLNASFSSEGGAVLTFLLTFCVKTKSKSGFGAEAPIKQNNFI